MKIVILNVPDDFDTSLVGHNLPADTLYVMESIDDDKLTNKEEMESLGKAMGKYLYRGFAYRENPDIYPDLKARDENRRKK